MQIGIPTVRGMKRRSGPQVAALLVAGILVPVVIVATVAATAWQDAWRTTERELTRSADGAAEYAERVLGTFHLTAKLVDNAIEGLSDEEIRNRESELNARLAAFLPAVPMANTIVLSDRDAAILLTAGPAPSPRVSIADRDWVSALRAPNPPSVYISQVSSRRGGSGLFFAVAIRRTGSGNGLPPDAFDGIINLSVSPSRMSSGLEAVTRHSEDVISLIRSDGEVLVRTPDFKNPLPPIPPQSALRAAAAAGAVRGYYTGQALGSARNRQIGSSLMIAYRRVGDLPLYATVSRPSAVVVAAWKAAVLPVALLGGLAAAALAILVLLTNRGQRRLAASEAEFRAAFESGAIGNALLETSTGRFVRVNETFSRITGYPAGDLLRGLTLSDMAAGPGASPGPATGVSGTSAGGLTRWRRADGRLIWVQLNLAPVGGTGDLELSIAAVSDVSERKAIEESQLLLAQEVDHRAKNALAVVQAMVRLTRADSIDGYVSAVEGRIRAVAKAHELLAMDRWRGAALRTMIAEALAATPDGGLRISLNGPDIWLKAAAVQPLSIAIHELATNAVKHGALADAAGRIDIAWKYDPAEGLELLWREHSRHAVGQSPPKRGLGLTIIERSVRQLDGTIELDRALHGMLCRIAVGPAHVHESAEPPVAEPAAPAGTHPLGLRAGRVDVLLVEDEPMVALDMAAALEAMGCRVIGPASTVAEARRLVSASPRIDAAVLDIQLGQDDTRALAHELRRAGVPVVFATGYSDLPVDAPDAPLLRKPVDPRDLAATLAELLERPPAESNQAGEAARVV